MQKQNRSIYDELSFTNAKNLAYVICATWSMSLTVPLRSACGRNYIGIHAVTVPVWIFLFAGASEIPELLAWIPVFWMGCFFNRITAAGMRRAGYHVHTYSRGDSWIGNKICFFSKSLFAGVVGEMIAVILIGWALSEGYHRPELMNYFLYGTVPMLVMELFAKQTRDQRDDAVRDAMVEQYGRYPVFQRRRW
jgi:hypothetical protein